MARSRLIETVAFFEKLLKTSQDGKLAKGIITAANTTEFTNKSDIADVKTETAAI